MATSTSIVVQVLDISDTDEAADLAARVYHFEGKLSVKQNRMTLSEIPFFLDFSRSSGIEKMYFVDHALAIDLDENDLRAFHALFDVDYLRRFADDLETIQNWRKRPTYAATVSARGIRRRVSQSKQANI